MNLSMILKTLLILTPFLHLIGADFVSFINREPQKTQRLKRYADSTLLSPGNYKVSSDFIPEDAYFPLISDRNRRNDNHRPGTSYLKSKGRSLSKSKGRSLSKTKGRSSTKIKGRSFPKTKGRSPTKAKGRGIDNKGRDVFNWNINTKPLEETKDEKDEKEDKDDKNSDEKDDDKHENDETSKDTKDPDIMAGIVGKDVEAEVSVGENATIANSEMASSAAKHIESIFGEFYDDPANKMAGFDTLDTSMGGFSGNLDNTDQGRHDSSNLEIGPPFSGNRDNKFPDNIIPDQERHDSPNLGIGPPPSVQPLMDNYGNRLMTVNLPVKSEGSFNEIIPGQPQAYVVYKNGKPFLSVGLLIPL